MACTLFGYYLAFGSSRVIPVKTGILPKFPINIFYIKDWIPTFVGMTGGGRSEFPLEFIPYLLRDRNDRGGLEWISFASNAGWE